MSDSFAEWWKQEGEYIADNNGVFAAMSMAWNAALRLSKTDPHLTPAVEIELDRQHKILKKLSR